MPTALWLAYQGYLLLLVMEQVFEYVGLFLMSCCKRWMVRINNVGYSKTTAAVVCATPTLCGLPYGERYCVDFANILLLQFFSCDKVRHFYQ